MRLLPIITICLLLFTLALLSGCTDVGDDFKSKVSKTNALMFDNFVKFAGVTKNADLAGIVDTASFLNRDAIEAESTILSMKNTNESLKQEYLDGLKMIEDGSFTMKNINVDTLLVSKGTKTYQDAEKKVSNGVMKIIEVEGNWNETAKLDYISRLKTMVFILNK